MNNTRVIILLISICYCETYITKYLIKKYDCESDGEYILNHFCRVKSIQRDVQSMLITINVVKPIEKFWVGITHYKKTYTNHYMPGFFNFNFNYCEMVNEKSASAAFSLNTLMTIFPTIYKHYRENIQCCPLMGNITVFNSTEERKTVTQLLIPPGEYKTEFRAYDASNKTLFLAKSYQVYYDKNRQS